MLPVLKDGQLVLAFKKTKLRPGSIVIVKRKDKEIIKRLNKIRGNKLYILGDNLVRSTDSREFGWITKEDVLATVIWPKN